MSIKIEYYAEAKRVNKNVVGSLVGSHEDSTTSVSPAETDTIPPGTATIRVTSLTGGHYWGFTAGSASSANSRKYVAEGVTHDYELPTAFVGKVIEYAASA